MRTTLWPLLQVDLLHTVRRVTQYLVLLMLVMIAIGSTWQSHSDTLDLQKADKAVRVHNSCWRTIRTLLVLIVYGRPSIKLGLLDYQRRRWLWTVLL